MALLILCVQKYYMCRNITYAEILHVQKYYMCRNITCTEILHVQKYYMYVHITCATTCVSIRMWIKKNIVNGFCLGDWTTELAIIASNRNRDKYINVAIQYLYSVNISLLFRLNL